MSIHVGKLTSAEPESGFVKLFMQHQRAIYGFILQLVHDPIDAEDILQTSGVVLWTKFEQYQQGTDFLAWARQIARFEVQSYLKSRRRSRVSFSSATIELLASDVTAKTPRQDFRHEALQICLQQLRPVDRELLSACYAPRASIREIAESIGRSSDGIYHSLRRIRQLLMRCVERRLSAEERQ